jgi:hypothetical protein
MYNADITKYSSIKLDYLFCIIVIKCTFYCPNNKDINFLKHSLQKIHFSNNAGTKPRAQVLASA